jgi:hypothetical protein
MRIYDPRLGKFLSADPLVKEYPELTPYQFASNSPIQAIDLDGLEGMRNIWIKIRAWWYEESDKSTAVGYGALREMGVQHTEDLKTVRYTNGEALLMLFGAAGYSMGHTGPAYAPRSKTSNARVIKQPQAIESEPSVATLPSKKITASEPVNITNRQTAAANNKNLNAEQSNSASVTLKIKTAPVPGKGFTFKSNPTTVSNGKINISGQQNVSGIYDFVITNEGKLMIGSSHYTLSGGAETVRAAGTLKIVNGQIKAITNSSGHYKPTVQQGENAIDQLSNMGLNTSKAFITLYNKDGSVNKAYRKQ